MRKMKSALLAVMVIGLMVVMSMADESYTLPVLQKSYASGVTTNISAVYTNPVGERLLIGSIWLQPVTNVSSISFSTDTTITNLLPCTLNSTTMYWLSSANGNLWLEKNGTLIISGLLAASNTTMNVTVFSSRPK